MEKAHFQTFKSFLLQKFSADHLPVAAFQMPAHAAHRRLQGLISQKQKPGLLAVLSVASRAQVLFFVPGNREDGLKAVLKIFLERFPHGGCLLVVGVFCFGPPFSVMGEI